MIEITLTHTKDLVLPQTVRSYIDSGCDEFSYVDEKTKLAHIAYRIKRGVNLLQDFIDDIKEHKETYGDYEDKAISSIAEYIEILRSDCTEGESKEILPQKMKMKFPAIFQLLVEEILYRYVEEEADSNKVKCIFKDAYYDYNEIRFRYKETYPATSERKFKEYISTSQETLRKINVNERDIKLKNNWNAVANNLCGNIIWSEDKKLTYPGDSTIIDEFNKRTEETHQYILSVPPMPFSGNLLKAKVVILTLNPGYKERINKTTCLAMCDEGKKRAMEHMKKALTLDGAGIYDDSDYSRIQGDFYWEDALSALAMAAYNKPSTEKSHPIYDDIAFLQYIGYHSTCFKYNSRLKQLPSTIFTNLLVKHLATNTDKTFLVLRSEAHWKEVFGDELWEKLEKDGRIITKGHIGRSQHISKDNLKKDNGFDKLVNILKR